MLTQFEIDMVSRAVKALETIADELKNLNEQKTKENKEQPNKQG